MPTAALKIGTRHWKTAYKKAMTENEQLRQAGAMAKKRLDDFADKANAGLVHHDAREWKRKIGAAFADFDSLDHG